MTAPNPKWEVALIVAAFVAVLAVVHIVRRCPTVPCRFVPVVAR